MRLMLLTTLFCAFLAGCQTLSSRSEPHIMNASEVRHLFSGQTVESYNLNTKKTSFTYYAAAGHLVQERLWSRREGEWSIDEDGKICLAIEREEAKCRHIVKRGDTYYKVLDESSGRLIRIVKYRFFAPGNALVQR